MAYAWGAVLKIIFLQNKCALYNARLFEDLSDHFDLVVFSNNFDSGVDGYEFNKRFLFNGFASSIRNLYLLVREKPNYIVFDGHSSFPLGFILALTKFIFSYRLVLWSLGAIPNRKKSFRTILGDLFSKFYAWSCSSIACYGSYSKEYFKSLGVSVDKLVLVQNSIDTDLIDFYRDFSNLVPINSRDKKIAYIGQLSAVKRVDVLVEAFYVTGLWESSYSLQIIGEGELKKKLVSSLALYPENFASKVAFLGDLRGPDLSIELSKTQVCVLPGLGGLAINTAMHHAIPVISGSADGTENDLVINDETGFRLKFVSATEIADCLVELISSPEKLNYLSKNSHRLVWEIATVDRQVDSFSKIFNFGVA